MSCVLQDMMGFHQGLVRVGGGFTYPEPVLRGGEVRGLVLNFTTPTNTNSRVDHV